ncbi:MAG TPA: sigma-54 dependent transcriptional regulator [Candidatus Nitrosotalea sp.]|nr:sigma-54 dependent transcriptional regulator [Candidatus Nitrosotalea sp.]
MATILCVDDEPSVGVVLEDTLQRMGHEPLLARSADEALAVLGRTPVDLIISDYRMPKTTGLDLLALLKAQGYDVPLIMLTGYASIEHAVIAIKSGAIDYLTKPVVPEALEIAVGQALELARLRAENEAFREEVGRYHAAREIVGESEALRRVLQTIAAAAPTRATVLLEGESGTGKELFAQALHDQSPRRDRPMITINCAAMPEGLVESSLFGHEKGAFTGAIRSKPGLVETAHRGTLFLDEIAELPATLQVKLLRALQERQIRRVGGTGLVDVDVRVVSATNRDLRDAIAKGHFREELYYRINVIAIHLPPLRERAGDVRLLAHTFLKRFGQARVTGMDDAAAEALDRYGWPGNVRELQNVIERACALADGSLITVKDLPDHVLQGHARAAAAVPSALGEGGLPARTDLTLKAAKDQWLQVLEVSYLRDLLARHDGNVSSAAKAAGIDRKTFHRLINKYDLRA